MSLERSDGRHSLSQRLGPSVVTFLVVAGGVYATAYVALSVLRHVVMPIFAVAAGLYAARLIFRMRGGHHPGKQG